MSCPKCSAPLPDGSSFCNKCGASLTANPLAPAPLGPADPEHDLWKGRFSARAHGHHWILWVLWVAALVVAFLKYPPQSAEYTRWIRIGFLVAAFLPLLGIVLTILRLQMSVRYRLTNYRLFRDSGIISRTINEIELVRVDDVSVHQNILQRIFNVGTITVIAPHDQTEPRLQMVGIVNPIEVKELIRNNVRRRRQGSLNVENL